MRLQPAALSRLREAADLRGQALTSFVLGAALQRASEVLEQEQRISLRRLPSAAAQRDSRDYSMRDSLADSLADSTPDSTPDSPADSMPDPPADSMPDPLADSMPDPDDPDIDLWEDYRVACEPPEMRMFAFRGLKHRRATSVARGLPPNPAEPTPPW